MKKNAYYYININEQQQHFDTDYDYKPVTFLNNDNTLFTMQKMTNLILIFCYFIRQTYFALKWF